MKYLRKTSFILAAVSAACLAACTPPGDELDDRTTPDCEGEDCSAQSACSSSVIGNPLLRRLTAREFKATLEAAFPSINGEWSSTFSPDPVSHLGFDNEASKLLVSKQTARELDATATSLAGAVATALPALLPCAESAPDRGCANEFINRYGQQLFRRPIHDEEKERYLAFFDEALQKTDFSQAMSWLTRALVMAPATVYRSEIGVVAEGERQLTPYEVATALAFTFTGGPPSQELMMRAQNGELASAEALRQEASALLATDAGKEQMQRFFEAFLSYSRVTGLTKAGSEEFQDLRADLAQETARFIEVVILEGRGGVEELLTDPRTFPSQAAASFYGLPAPASDFAEIVRPEGQGIGVLAQSSILATEASPDSSSPTQRGLLVYERLLCGEELTVPPDVPEIPAVEVGARTTRERYELAHAAPAGCNTCHREFDPIGFGFEHFDEMGRYRADEGGLEIDPTGTIPNTEIDFASQEDLARGLASMESVGLCVTSQMKVFAFGNEEACLGEVERSAFAQGAIGFVDYLASLAAEPNFTARRSEEK